MTAVSVPRKAKVSVPRWIKLGALGGLIMIFLASIGFVATFEGRMIIRPYLSLGYLLLAAVPFTVGYVIAQRHTSHGVNPAPVGGTDIATGAAAGALAGLIVGGFTALVDAAPGIRGTFPNMSPRMVDILSFGQNVGTGILLMVLMGVATGGAAAAIRMLPEKVRKGMATGALTIVILAVFQSVVDNLFKWFATVPDLLYVRGGGMGLASALVVFALSVAGQVFLPGRVPSIRQKLAEGDPRTRTRNSVIAAIVVIIIMLILPQFLGGVLNELFTNVGLFLLMALGLNIVVGLAGLLDLGYVAFFAVGAYTMALLTSPISPRWAPMLSWWEAFPFVIIACMIAGLFVGTPVIRMRGDYLAIVTLGFGEIVRLTLLSDWMSAYFGGAQGIRNVPGIPVFGNEINATSPGLMIYAVIFFVLVAVYITWRVQDSRLGRAWAAIREDEDIAEAVGVDTVKAKLLAFITGATLAGFAGALFAAKVGSVFTNSFEILVSIIILVIVIVGGMGSIPGVAAGALVLVGVLGGPNLPGLLQELGQFKLLIYGALLVFMMLMRPEGLIPSARRARELHQEEYLQDAWLDKGEASTAEAVAEDA